MTIEYIVCNISDLDFFRVNPRYFLVNNIFQTSSYINDTVNLSGSTFVILVMRNQNCEQKHNNHKSA